MPDMNNKNALKGPSRNFPKKTKPNRFAHTANTQYGMGDHYGTGVRAPLAKIRDGVGMKEISNKGIKKPPRSLA